MKNRIHYYLVRLDPPPYRCGVYHNRAENYHWENRGSATNFRVEFSYLQEGRLHKLQDKCEYIYPQGSVIILIHAQKYQLNSPDRTFHEFHFSFQTEKKPERIEPEAVVALETTDNIAILADQVTDPAACREIAKQIKAMIGMANSDKVARNLIMCTALYRCLTILTQQAVILAKQELESKENQYSQITADAIRYIHEHLHENLSLSNIAKAIGINYHTLRLTFRREMKLPMSEYINHAKIRQVEKLITANDMTLEEAGAAVGIPDRTYLSRLFRKCTGMTAREYRKVYAARTEKNMNTTQK